MMSRGVKNKSAGPPACQEIAAQAQPQQRHFGRQLAHEGGEIHDVARREK